MALTTTTATLIRQYNAFTGLSALERSQSGIARAEIVYYNVNDNWPGAGGNSRLYTSGTIDLPKDYGYVVTDVFVRATSSAQEFIAAEAVGDLDIYVGGALGPQINCQLVSDPSRQDEDGGIAIGTIQARKYNSNWPTDNSKATMTWSLRNKPTALLYPFGSGTYTSTPNPATQFRFSIGEGDLNQGDLAINCYVRFLQYDIDQSYNYVIQSPQLTR